MQKKYAIDDINVFKQKVLNWLKQFSTFCFLDSNSYTAHQQLLVGAGSVRRCVASGTDALKQLQLFLDTRNCWRFGHLCYELQTSERTNPPNKDDLLQFPDLAFFEPEIVLQLQAGNLAITAEHPDRIFQSIQQESTELSVTAASPVQIEQRINRNEYLSIIHQLKNHIKRGDCYEINFCQEFYVQKIEADPFLLYQKLNQLSPNPFSGLYRIEDKWLISASPERFVQKRGAVIMSQPIKGTLQRNTPGSEIKTEQLLLRNSEKDKAENVMVVDLVRNDLSRICEEGSVKVDELFGIYTFPQVHQMISTISGTLNKSVNFSEIINATFPMRSMTGAPKISVLHLIDKYEKSKRGIFSGTLGYIDPNNDFDFNVIIRSIMYNQKAQYLSFQAGSGITIYSDAEKEWEECMIKAAAIKSILES